MSRPQSSLTRKPEPYSSSRIARSRSPDGVSVAGVSTTSFAESTDRSVGSPRRTFGVASSSAGHVETWPRRRSQRIHVRVAATLREMELGAWRRASSREPGPEQIDVDCAHVVGRLRATLACERGEAFDVATVLGHRPRRRAPLTRKVKQKRGERLVDRHVPALPRGRRARPSSRSVPVGDAGREARAAVSGRGQRRARTGDALLAGRAVGDARAGRRRQALPWTRRQAAGRARRTMRHGRIGRIAVERRLRNDLVRRAHPASSRTADDGNVVM